MHERKLQIGVLFMVLIIALVALGVGYGLWAQVLTISGTVHTGEVNAQFSIEEIDQVDAGLVHDDGVNEHNEIEGKNVGECKAWLEDGLPNKGVQTLKMEIFNGYPSFSCFVNFNVENIGTIPIKVHQPKIVSVSPGLRVEFLTGVLGSEGCYYDEVNGSAVPPVDPHPQLHPGEMKFCTIWVHVEQSAEQNATLGFEATIFLHQWNEEP